MSAAVSAQPKAGKELLKIKSVQPATPAKLPLGESVTVEIEFNNPSKIPVRVFAMPYSNGAINTKCSVAGSPTFPQGAGTATRHFFFRESTDIDEIRITMTDSVSRQEVAVLKLPVEMIWGDGRAAAPATAKRAPAASQTGPLRFDLQGYEVSQDAATALFISHPGKLDPKALLTATSALVAAEKATLVKLPFVEAASGARAVATPAGGYSLEAQFIQGAGEYVETLYILRRTSDQSGSSNAVLMHIGGTSFLGSLPGSSANTVVLMFARLSAL